MGRLNNRQLLDNLPHLQNCVKRDPASYKEEFLIQYNHFVGIMDIFSLTPDQPNKTLDELTMFIAQVAQHYVEELISFPQKIVNILQNHGPKLEQSIRFGFCRALILLRNKNLIPALDLMELFFQLLRCPDKSLRTFLESYIVSDIKNMNMKHKDMKLNSTLQNFMYSNLKESNQKAATISARIMIDLYKKNIWNDAKTVNVIANVGCFSPITKVMVTSLQFFLGNDVNENEDESDSENEPDLKGALMVNKVNKKTKKRKRKLENIKKLVAKSKKKKTQAPLFNFSGIVLVHNPQGMAEQLFKQLQNQNHDFEIKLIHLDVISRLIGIHELFLFNFYPYITRFLQPHQRQVTRVLQFAAQASHELVPGDIIEPVLKTIANHFITEHNSSDVMAIGLNAVREICVRCPLAMSEDLLRDLTLYKSYKEKSVMMAARSLISLFREQLPDLLHKKDRGRPTDEQKTNKIKNYGEVIALDHIPGAEVLLETAKTVDMENNDSDSDSDNDDNWINVEHDISQVSQKPENDKSITESIEADTDGEQEDTDVEIEDTGDENNASSKVKWEDDSIVPASKILNEKSAVVELATTRLFTDADFKRIDMANIKRKMTNSTRKQVIEKEKSEYVQLQDIEMIYKKRNSNKQERLESVMKGREGREKFGGYKDGRKDPHCSKTNREKRKRKNFGMMRLKARTKVKKSFKEKQQSLRKHLIKRMKMK